MGYIGDTVPTLNTNLMEPLAKMAGLLQYQKTTFEPEVSTARIVYDNDSKQNYDFLKLNPISGITSRIRPLMAQIHLTTYTFNEGEVS